jgi:filamentous hemagglutinin family protein
MRKQLPLTGLAMLCFAGNLCSQVVTDGSLGAAAHLMGPDYRIEQGLGTVMGGNLFHSFDLFNINSGESATFSAGLGIEHVVARVSGGSVSMIDGRLGVDSFSTPSLWLINPAGVLFGSGASLDLPGSFHVSSADYLALGEDGLLSASLGDSSLLSSAPPSAFGFLDGNAGTIHMDGSRLELDPGQSFSAVASEILINDGVVYAPSGDIGLVAVGSAGELAAGGSSFDLGGFDQLGRVAIQHPSGETIVNGGRRGGNLDVSSEAFSELAPGNVWIHGGEIIIDNASVRSVNRDASDAGTIEIRGRDSVSLSAAATITSVGLNTGDNAAVFLAGGSIQLTDSALVLSRNDDSGSGGEVSVSGSSLILNGGAAIRAETGVDAAARGADITIDVAELALSDAATIASLTFSEAAAGDVSIVAGNLTVSDDAIIQASTRGAGDAGDIQVIAETVSLSGAGTIEVSSGFLGSTDEFGDAGNIDIVSGSLQISGNDALISSETLASGQGGTISIQASEISMNDGATISARSDGTGLAGDILLSTAQLTLISASILTSARFADGGNVRVELGESLFMQDSVLATEVSDGDGNGGNIQIAEPRSLVLQRSSITANAFGGDGGNIGIIADGVILDNSSSITASSTLGVDGEIRISSPENDVESSLALLPSDFLRRSQLLVDGCTRRVTNQSKLSIEPDLAVPIHALELIWVEPLYRDNLSRQVLGALETECDVNGQGALKHW